VKTESKPLLTSAIFLIVGLAFLFIAYEDWTSDSASMRMGEAAYRASEPVKFKWNVGAHATLGLGGFAAAIITLARQKS